MILIVFLFFLFPQSEPFEHVETIKGKKVEIRAKQDTVQFFIFVHGWSCKECFGQLDSALNQIELNKEIQILIRSPKMNIITKKEYLRYAYQFFDKNKYSFYFDCHPNADGLVTDNLKGGYFGKYNVDKTPGLLIIKDDRSIFLNYMYLFSGEPSISDLRKLIMKKVE